jgi:predicted RNase H-like HicB family nuclease
MKTYEVTAERDNAFWFIHIPELDGATQARTEEEIPVMARDYIAITLGVPAESFDVDVRVRQA